MKKIHLFPYCSYPEGKKILIIMRISLLLLTIGLLQLHASVYSQNTRLDLNVKNQSLREVFKEIESKSQFRFFFSDNLLLLDQKVQVNAENSNVEQILDKLLVNTEYSYKVMENSLIVIAPKNFVSRMQKKVTGVVTDALNGDKLVGVNIVIEGTTVGAISDFEGKFSIDITGANPVLIFTYIGYNTEKISVNGQTILDVKLVQDITKLDEVVVIGYGSVKKSDLTGAVASVSAKDLGDRQATGIADLIQGKAAGVDVTRGTIRVRGVTTLNNTDPLYVVDGFAGGNLDAVNPSDIESIEILKDASSTAIYGTRGANGVILVTTKNGKAGALKINVNFNTGFTTLAKKIDVLNASQYIDYRLEGLKNSGQTPSDRLLGLDPAFDVRKDITNWQEAQVRPGLATKNEANINFAGGSERSTFFLSLGLRTIKSVTGNEDKKEIYLRNKNTFKLNSWLKFGDNISLRFVTQKGSFGGTNSVLTLPPYLPIKDANNSWGYTNVNRNIDMTDRYNPVPMWALSDNEGHELNYQTNFFTEIEPLKGLVFRSQFGVNGKFNRNTGWSDYYVNGGVQTSYNNWNQSQEYSYSPLLENYLTYSRIFGKHDLSLMVGNTYQDGAFGRKFGYNAEQFVDTEVKIAGNAKTSKVTSEDYWKYAYLSYYGRFNYQFNGKYLLTVNVRRDASKRFAPQNHWATFPAVALVWKLHEEKFIQDLNVFDQLRFRVGWGITGNDNLGGDFRYTPQVLQKGVYYALGDKQVPVAGSSINTNSSPDIKWESTESKNAALEFGFLKNKLTFSIEYFIKSTNDILFTVPRPISLGYGHNNDKGDAVVNAASVKNNGLEFLAGYQNTIGEINFSIQGNYTFVHNEVTSLGLGQPYLDGASKTDVGNSIGYFYGFVADGVFMKQSDLDAANQAARDAALKADPNIKADKLKDTYYQQTETGAGDVRFKDLNGDGIINEKDRTKLGSSIPKHNYGLNISIGWRGIDFNVIGSGIAGSQIWNATTGWLSGGESASNQSTLVLNRWKSEAEPGNGIQPRAKEGNPANNFRNSSLYIANGDYFKIHQISVGYNFPKSLASKVGLEKVRVYASASNYFTFSKYIGFDPEVGGGNLQRGIDGYNDWATKSIVFGIQIGL